MHGHLDFITWLGKMACENTWVELQVVYLIDLGLLFPEVIINYETMLTSCLRGWTGSDKE